MQFRHLSDLHQAAGVALMVGLAALAQATAAAFQAPGVSSDNARVAISIAEAVDQPRIDGLLDDDIWTSATRIDRFVQERPTEGAPASEATDVYLAYDADHLYVGVRAHYSDPSLIRANRVDRDQIWTDDTIRLIFDPFVDQQRAYVFAINGFGIQGDSLLSVGSGGGGRGGGGGGGGVSTGGERPDNSWNALFTSAGVLTEQGWTAEMAIPFKSLRYPSRDAGQAHEWGFQIQRTVEGKRESAVWAPISREIPGMLRQLGRLTGLRDLSTSRNLELLPTFTAIQLDRRSDDTGELVGDASREAGLNVKYGLTSNLSLDFTVNPDFSQVESDRPQIETNQRFPLFFPEQRPFFVEGQENFAARAPVTVLHTRTIVAPRVGAKVTGKVGNALVGLLLADDRAPGRTDDKTDPHSGQSARVFVGRVRYVLPGDAYLGGIVTDREFVDTYSRLAGVDGQYRFGGGGSYRLRFSALTAAHRDDESVERRGNVWDIRFDKSGRNFQTNWSHEVVDPDFRTDLGFVRRTDTRETSGSFRFTFFPEGTVTNWGPGLRLERIYDSSGTLQNSRVSLSTNLVFRANASLDLEWEQEDEWYQDVLFPTRRFTIEGSIDRLRWITLTGRLTAGRSVRFVDDAFLGDSTTGSLTAILRPVSRLRSEIALTTSRLVDPRTGDEAFDVRITRVLSTYQFTNRFLVRNITEYDTSDRTVGVNLLGTYRVNAGTVFYVGYDDHYEQRSPESSEALLPLSWRRTNRAFFAKLQFLLRY